MEEANTFLTNRAFMEFLGNLPKHGSLETKADEARKRLPALLDQLDKIAENIQEFIPHK